MIAAAIAASLIGPTVEQCFPVEALSPNDRELAEELLLEALDGEGLYTLVGEIKPMSSSVGRASVSTTGRDLEERAEALAEADRMRRVFRALDCGPISFALLPYARDWSGERTLDGYVFHAETMAREIAEHQGFFAYWGVTPSTPGPQVVMAFESGPGPYRSRAFGYLFGYPDHAVDFFVDAELGQRRTGEFVSRDFFQIPTFASETGRFVYAVPPGYEPRSVDLELRANSQEVLDEYKIRREQWVGEGKAGPVAMLRDWYADLGWFAMEER